MQSVKNIYKIGFGPSSSHTMAPVKAATLYKAKFPADEYKVVIYDSLAKTGKGHLTDKAIIQAFAHKKVTVVFDPDTAVPHPNTMDFYTGDGENFVRVFSVGGGEIVVEGEPIDDKKVKNVYPHNTFRGIVKFCEKNGLSLSEYVFHFEDEDIHDYLLTVWRTMNEAISAGLKATGVLGGGLRVERKAKMLFNQRFMDESPETRESRLVCAFAYAVSEQNAGGGKIVTAPTCGACGVLPAVLSYMKQKRKFSDEDFVRALAVAGLIGNLIKTNASISGAECGCQAEIGSACSMAAAALGELFGMSISQIEYAAEMAIEHHLGLTCDPVNGLVQIPCIERNAVAAMRAINSVNLASFLYTTRKISFDTIVKTMYETGKDLSNRYRETSEGGLAKSVQIKTKAKTPKSCD
ncbi:MAG: L-serine ammonia-lyase [Clostridia bacterium]|nr:L-serine ammonia-lyase [Clostridia bacterium]